MGENRDNIVRENIGEILEYQSVLSNIFKRKVSLEQAIADWLERVYARQQAKERAGA